VRVFLLRRECLESFPICLPPTLKFECRRNFSGRDSSYGVEGVFPFISEERFLKSPLSSGLPKTQELLKDGSDRD